MILGVPLYAVVRTVVIYLYDILSIEERESGCLMMWGISLAESDTCI